MVTKETLSFLLIDLGRLTDSEQVFQATLDYLLENKIYREELEKIQFPKWMGPRGNRIKFLYEMGERFGYVNAMYGILESTSVGVEELKKFVEDLGNKYLKEGLRMRTVGTTEIA